MVRWRFRKPSKPYGIMSFSLPVEQIVWYKDMNNASEFLRKHTDEWMLAKMEEELACLKEREELLNYKRRCLMYDAGCSKGEWKDKIIEQAKAVSGELDALGERIKELEDNITTEKERQEEANKPKYR